MHFGIAGPLTDATYARGMADEQYCADTKCLRETLPVDDENSILVHRKLVTRSLSSTMPKITVEEVPVHIHKLCFNRKRHIRVE